MNLHPLGLVAQGTVQEYREVHLGMEVRMLLVGDSARTHRAAAMGYDRIAELEDVLSDWRAGSEVRRLERQPAGTWQPVSPVLHEVLALALTLAHETGGAFDPTVGPLTVLWREAQRTGMPATDAAIAAARTQVGYQLVELEAAGSRVRLMREGMRLDLGAIAKGWILDAVADALRAVGIRSALLEAGGDLVVTGPPPNARGWRVVVPMGSRDTVLVLAHQAVSTSGPGVQWIAGTDGVRESHVIAPATGRGTRGGRAVVVLGSRGAITDALATALTLVPASTADALAARYGVIWFSAAPR